MVVKEAGTQLRVSPAKFATETFDVVTQEGG